MDKEITKTCSGKDSSSQATVLAGSLLLHELSTGCSFLWGISTCLGVGYSTGCRVDICSTRVFQGLQRSKLHLHHPPSSLTLVSAGLFLSHFLTSLKAATQHFLPFLKYIYHNDATSTVDWLRFAQG